MTDPMSFDEYREQHGNTEAEAPAAFAAYLHEITEGEWDDRMEKVEPGASDDVAEDASSTDGTDDD